MYTLIHTLSIIKLAVTHEMKFNSQIQNEHKNMNSLIWRLIDITRT